jgi:hypothetical protein
MEENTVLSLSHFTPIAQVLVCLARCDEKSPVQQRVSRCLIASGNTSSFSLDYNSTGRNFMTKATSTEKQQFPF